MDQAMKNITRYEDDIPDGIYAVPLSPKQPKVKVRALFDYCKANGIQIQNLSEQELSLFLVYD